MPEIKKNNTKLKSLDGNQDTNIECFINPDLDI